jgi:hypothetical protein
VCGPSNTVGRMRFTTFLGLVLNVDLFVWSKWSTQVPRFTDAFTRSIQSIQSIAKSRRSLAPQKPKNRNSRTRNKLRSLRLLTIHERAGSVGISRKVLHGRKEVETGGQMVGVVKTGRHAEVQKKKR